MTKTEITTRILDWEDNNEESFYDYFMHDNVHHIGYTFWLLGKGYTLEGNLLLDKMVKQQADGERTYLTQEEMFHIHQEYSDKGDWDYDAHKKNINIIADFLVDSQYHGKKFAIWIEEQDRAW